MDYVFAPGVSACLADGRLVVLNVLLDRYFMLPSDAGAALRRAIERQSPAPGDRALLGRLCTNGLVLKRASKTCLELCHAAEPLQSLVDNGWTPPGGRQVAIAGLRALRAAWSLKVSGLDGVLRSTRASAPPDCRENDPARALGVAAAFAELRFAWRALDRCLPLSIALAAAAKRQDRRVSLMLGVRCSPFAAHAWVQLDRSVLNDRLDTVRSFTPILSL